MQLATSFGDDFAGVVFGDDDVENTYSARLGVEAIINELEPDIARLGLHLGDGVTVVFDRYPLGFGLELRKVDPRMAVPAYDHAAEFVDVGVETITVRFKKRSPPTSSSCSCSASRLGRWGWASSASRSSLSARRALSATNHRRFEMQADETLLLDLNADEQAAILNLIRVTSDEWADVEDGADAPRGTLEALAERTRSAR
jgi:hypothetical protein